MGFADESSVLDESIHLRDELNRIISNNDHNEESSLKIVDNLRNIEISVEILQKTQIGVLLNTLRKSSPFSSVQSAARSLIKSWRVSVELSSKHMNNSSHEQLNERRDEEVSPDTKIDPKSESKGTLKRKIEDTANAFIEEESESKKIKPQPTKNLMMPSDIKPNINQPTSYTPVYDSYRISACEILKKALRLGSNPDFDPSELASQIEQAIFEISNSADQKYFNCIRSKAFNLRDTKNINFKMQVLCGQIQPEDLAKMTPEQMASDELKKMRQEIHQEAAKEHQLGTSGATQSTSLFKCNRCGKKNCIYTQAQTRSSDEPMTTFVCCMECGNRWKFC